MKENVSTSTRVLGLLIELLGAERPRSKRRLRELPGYRGLSDAAFESQFQRDKSALRDAGILIELVGGGDDAYTISSDSFASAPVALDDLDAALVQLAVSAWNPREADPSLIDPKIAAHSTGASAAAGRLTLGLEGAETVARIVEAIADRRIVSFEYRSANGAFARAVEPWRLVVRGRALYLWGADLDREGQRLFRLSRFDSPVEFLGEPGDAGPVPEDLAAPFEAQLIAPLLLVRETAAAGIRRFIDEGDGLRDGKWREARGEPGERGEWVSRILSEVEDVVVLEPEDLREEILERLRVAESWGGANA